ncbi:hypothetical protein GCM10010168_21350 [Actinoplanes ianthinogenes]|nr:hypothetical protein [Actinoplanes ianthinogenes]GGR04103.1 hypothetical protein GCM10010168_21350 [Actinoplanes ianthinogenes]
MALTGVLATAGVLIATAMGPVHAGGTHQGDPISAAFPDIDVPVGGTAIDPLGPSLWSTKGPATYTGAKVSYELNGVAGVSIAPSDIGGGDCDQPSATRVVCTDPRPLSFEGETIEQYLPVVVKAAKTAEAGDTGTVTITFSAKGVEAFTGTSKVRVVEGEERLPVTGSAAGTIGGLGLLLLGAGTAGVLIARRRRARFTA